MDNNSIAHLVARALRARRTVTWQYRQSQPSNACRFHGRTRSQILKDVRHDLKTAPDEYTYGLEYDAANSKLPNGYGLQAYRIKGA
jgi:hypothetical protein